MQSTSPWPGGQLMTKALRTQCPAHASPDELLLMSLWTDG
jgi:hypothetical protein